MSQSRLRFAVRKFDRFEDAIQKQWDAYKQATGSTYEAEFVPMDLHDLYDAILGNNGLIKGDWDITFLSSDWFRDAYERRATVDLTPLLAHGGVEGYPHDWPESLLAQKFDDTLIGFTWHDGPECLIYRKDLFNNPDEQAAWRAETGKELVPPTNWDDFHEIARFFHRPDEGLYGSVFAAFPDGHNTVYDFCLQVWSRGGELFDEDGHPNLLSDEVRAGLSFYRAIVNDQDAVHPNCRELESTRAGKVLADGEVAMAVNWFGFAAIAAEHASSKVRGNIDIAPVPGINGGTSLNSYWCLAIGVGSRHINEAWKFLRFAATPEMDKLNTACGNIGCRISTWQDPEINRSIPFYHRLEPLHEVARMLPQRPDWADIATVIDAVVLDTINSNAPIDEIVARHQATLDKR